MKIAIYCGEKGTTPETRKQMSAFAHQFFKNHQVFLVNGKSIRSGELNNTVDYLFVPGGSTTEMLRELKPEGVRIIKKYVTDGGKYVGICAGSYLACAVVDFKSADMSLKKARPLKFYPGTQKGPFNGHYSPLNNQGFQCIQPVFYGDIKVNAVLNGGGFFVDAEKYKNVEILGRYEGGEACAVRCDVENGEAYLLAVHLEYQPELMRVDEHIQQADIEKLKLSNPTRFDLWCKILSL